MKIHKFKVVLTQKLNLQYLMIKEEHENTNSIKKYDFTYLPQKRTSIEFSAVCEIESVLCHVIHFLKL